MSQASLLYLHAITPVHSGTGQAAAIVDLPIAREKATGFPYLPASSVKGVLRDALLKLGQNDNDIDCWFGKAEAGNDAGSAGLVCFADQRLICLPVRSYFGTFAYVTCPLVLSRLLRDVKALRITSTLPTDLLSVEDGEDSIPVLVAEGSVLPHGAKVYMEYLDLMATTDERTTALATALAALLFADSPNDFVSRFAIVSNNVFSFLSDTATEVSARIMLNEKSKTSGNLWYEEALPAESLFCGPFFIEKRKDVDTGAVLEQVLTSLGEVLAIQIGGKSSVGRGLCRVIVSNP